jgi:hypothetical protein
MSNAIQIAGVVALGFIAGVILLNSAGYMNITVKNKDKIIFTTEQSNDPTR